MFIPLIDESVLTIIFSSAVVGFATIWAIFKAVKLLNQG